MRSPFPASLPFSAALTSVLGCGILSAFSQDAPPVPARPLLETYCFDCHDTDLKKGDLDLSALTFDPENAKSRALWARIHDRVRDGEMPPKDKSAPTQEERAALLEAVSAPLIAADAALTAREGRSVWRRLNRYEYENTLRDLLGAPWLALRDSLPEDGEAHRFNKSGAALDVSHIQAGRWLATAESALRQAVTAALSKSDPAPVRYYARDSRGFTGKAKFSEFNRSPERATFPIVDFEADLSALEENARISSGDATRRDREAMGVVASCYEPMEIQFDKFRAPVSGRYRLTIEAFTFWAGPESEKKWWRPDRAKVAPGRTSEPVCVYAQRPPREVRKLGSFDVSPDPSQQSLEVWLQAGDTIRPDAVRLFRSRPPNWQNPLAERDGQPGVAFRWLEVAGPLTDPAAVNAAALVFGDLPVKATRSGLTVTSTDPLADAGRLLRRFLAAAFRRPVEEADVNRFLTVIRAALDAGLPFADAVIAGDTAALCSPEFMTLRESPGPLDDYALAARLSYFLGNSMPDAALRVAADGHTLTAPDTLRAETRRLLAAPRAEQFVTAFLDYWLDLRKADATSADATLYPDYYLDDYLVESAVDETRAFFAELIRQDLPARNLVASDFSMLNDRLARHYELPAITGSAIRRVDLPADSVRGGLLTQAAVLKVTANGTTTSPVVRGAWVMERMLGKKPPPPPPNLPTVDPDTRGATTIREQLAKHRTQASCNACHVHIDPPGFAMEAFDVLGGFRSTYRALGDTARPLAGFGKNGQPFAFHAGPPVDATGELPGGAPFSDIREFKRLLLQDERALARNLASQFLVFATGTPVRFGDRAALEAILDRAASSGYGVRSLIEEIVQSDLFRHK